MTRNSRSFRTGTVVVVVLILAMSGTAAATAFVVSKNSQVGPNTISGHVPPSGDHANIVSGSVGTNDIATGTIRAADLAPLAGWQGFNSVFSTFGCSAQQFWTDFDPPTYAPFGFRKDAFGVVHLRGSIACPTPSMLGASADVLRLKPPFCPKADEVFPVATGNGSGSFVMSIMEIDAVPPTDNNCLVKLGAGADTAFVSLSGIEFDTRS
jgi:hypothetical protein